MLNPRFILLVLICLMACTEPSKTRPQIQSFLAVPLELGTFGTTFLLTWEVFGATMMSIDQNVGELKGLNQTTIRLSSDTVLTLTAQNQFGTVNKSLELKVNPSKPLQLVELSFSDPSVQLAQTAFSTKRSASLMPWIQSAGEQTSTTVDGVRYLSFGFDVFNPKNGEPFQNLTLYALSFKNLNQVSSLAETAFHSVFDVNAQAFADLELVKKILPSHKLIEFAGRVQVDSSGADWQVLNEAEVATIQAQIQGDPNLSGHVQVLGYGFVARKSLIDPARVIQPGSAGHVTIAFQMPVQAQMPQSWKVHFLVWNNPITSVLESLPEQHTRSAINRANELPGSRLRVLPGSDLGVGDMVCPVRIAGFGANPSVNLTPCS